MSNAVNSTPLLEVNNLKKYFPIKAGLLSKTVGHVKAVDDVSFKVMPGETVGMVGESGCGKTTCGRTVLRLLEPTAGSIKYMGNELNNLSYKKMLEYRPKMQIIFQDPFSSLNPRKTVMEIVGECLDVYDIAHGAAREDKVAELLSVVGLSPMYINRYPHEFSGGQRQRIGIARAIALNPSLIICDEPVSALDVSIQAQVINLLIKLREEMGLAYLFIAHDLSVVKHISDRIIVMYLGRIVEQASKDELFDNPRHPYTRALLSAVPEPDPRRKSQRIILKGDVPTPINPPQGCHFHPRCPVVMEECKTQIPPLRDLGNGHQYLCWRD